MIKLETYHDPIGDPVYTYCKGYVDVKGFIDAMIDQGLNTKVVTFPSYERWDLNEKYICIANPVVKFGTPVTIVRWELYSHVGELA